MAAVMCRFLLSKMTEITLQWLKQLIRNNNVHPFYSSAMWQRVAAEARREQHNECQRCKENGYYSPCEIVHHIKHVKQYPELALEVDNLECLCRDCHTKEHISCGDKKADHGRDKGKGGYTNEERW